MVFVQVAVRVQGCSWFLPRPGRREQALFQEQFLGLADGGERQAGSPGDIQQAVLPIRLVEHPEQGRLDRGAILRAARGPVQAALDEGKTQAERNKLGQFATPPALAADILTYAKTLLPAGGRVRFLDPAIGTGAFYSALLKTFPDNRIECARGFEVDAHYGQPAARLWASTGLSMELADFTRQKPPAQTPKPRLKSAKLTMLPPTWLFQLPPPLRPHPH